MNRTFLLITVFQLFVCINGECSGGCNEPIRIYEDLKCKPIYSSPFDCCPEQFDCSHIDNGPKDQCHFNGELYGKGQILKREDIYSNCHTHCKCKEKIGRERTDFRCGALGCLEWLLPQILEPDCYWKYELNKCCAVGQACQPFDEVETCEVDGNVYFEGQRFSSVNHKCIDCVCQKGFDRKFVAPFCTTKSCAIEVKHSFEIENYCAPFYVGRDDCCPYMEWLCPSKDDIIIIKSNQDAELKCKFGNSTLDLKDKFERPSLKTYKKAVICECRIPPFLTCFKKPEI